MEPYLVFYDLEYVLQKVGIALGFTQEALGFGNRPAISNSSGCAHSLRK